MVLLIKKHHIMRKKQGLTIVERAILAVPGFKEVFGMKIELNKT